MKLVLLSSQPLQGVRTQRAAWAPKEGPRLTARAPRSWTPSLQNWEPHISAVDEPPSLLQQSGRREALSFVVRPALEHGLLISNGGNTVIEAAAL